MDAEALASEIRATLQRAGLVASEDQIAQLVDPYSRMRAGLAALRQRLDASAEPAVTFASAERTSDGSDRS